MARSLAAVGVTSAFFALAGTSAVLAGQIELPPHVSWNEAFQGDLSNAGTSPTTITLPLGTSQIIGSVGTGDTIDFFRFTIPANTQMTGFTNSLYNASSGDTQGFTGLALGSTFSGNVFSAGSYAGYAHFGPAARNGTLPPTNLVGVNLLPLMADTTTIAPGSTGFTTPLGPGTYTFLIQQLGGTTNYRFDFALSLIPTPTSAAALALPALLLTRRRRGQ
jgi:hypothetical protein